MLPAIPQTDLRAEYLELNGEIDGAMRRVLDRSRFILGEDVKQFENAFASYLGAGHAIGVASGTDALFLALRAFDIGPGDEVITVSHTAVATIAAIMQTGAKPVLVDVDPRTFTLAPDRLPAVLSSRTKAIVPVHLYGQPADMVSILAFARQHNLRVIEDCAQAHGAACRADPVSPWQKVGTLGDAAAFSFYPTKNLGAFGDGGCVVTKDAALAEQVRLLRQYGWRNRYISEVPGWNSRLDEIQAAVLGVKLNALDRWNEARRKTAEVYDQNFAGSVVGVTTRRRDVMHVFHQYVIRVKNRDRLREALAQAGVGTAIHYPVPVHQQPAYRSLGTGADLQITEALCTEILSLPMSAHIETKTARRVAAEVLRAVAEIG
ncbi:MAG: DegT/DnrJ/EryC1/StrS family aminotransferase [Verrucomicrobiota bacterium]